MHEIIHDFRKPFREVSYTDPNDQISIPATGAAGFGGVMVLDIEDEATRGAFCLMYAALVAVMDDNWTLLPKHIRETVAAAIEQAERMGVR